MTIEYVSVDGWLRESETVVYMCMLCGAMTWDNERHSQWHNPPHPPMRGDDAISNRWRLAALRRFERMAGRR